MVRTNRAAHCLLLPDFPDRVLSAHRIYREPVHCSCARFHLRSAQRTLVDRWPPRRIFVEGARERNRVTADVGGGSRTPMVRWETLALAMALDRRRPGWGGGLFIFELAHLGRPFCVS